MSAERGASSGPISGFVRREVKEMKFGMGRRAMTVGMMDFFVLEMTD